MAAISGSGTGTGFAGYYDRPDTTGEYPNYGARLDTEIRILIKKRLNRLERKNLVGLIKSCGAADSIEEILAKFIEGYNKGGRI